MVWQRFLVCRLGLRRLHSPLQILVKSRHNHDQKVIQGGGRTVVEDSALNITPTGTITPAESAQEENKAESILNGDVNNKNDDVFFDWNQLKPSRLYRDWRTLQIGNQPLPNPPDYVDDSNFSSFYRLSYQRKMQVLKHTFSETMELYKIHAKWYVDQDLSNAKVKEILVKDDEIMAEIDRKIREHKQKSDPNSDLDSKELDATIDAALKVYKENMKQVKDMKSAVATVMDNRENIKTFAAKKLETVAMIISDFMAGYKEGKEAGVVDALRDDGFVGDILRAIKEKDFDGIKSKVEAKVGSVVKEYKEFDPAASKAETIAEDSLVGKIVNIKDKIDTQVDSIMKEYQEFDESRSRAQASAENGLVGKLVNMTDKVDAKVDSVVKEYKDFDETNSKNETVAENIFFKKFVAIKEGIDGDVRGVAKEYEEFDKHSIGHKENQK